MELYDKIKDITQNLINKIDDNTYNINIQPKASILNVFSRLNYKSWYAIAEFVDNSTQSYLSNADTLNKLSDFDYLEININYNPEENSLTISDNAFGMELERFKDAILLDAKNSSQTGRNEFGMGLKTAASWFGNVWTVESTQLGSKNKYSATINIPYLKESNENFINIERMDIDPLSHGTTVVIKDVTKKITAPRTIKKIKELLSSMYRRDINNRNIIINFNNEPISFNEYKVLELKDKKWKKDVNFTFKFENKNYTVTGFVAIMDPGSFVNSGFALFRQDRVIIGGPDQNYKPSKIFGQMQSQVSLKLFGELNMNDFPVNQAKDGFVWDDGLEDEFIDNLKSQIQEYIKIANLSKNERAQEEQFSKSTSDIVKVSVSKSIINLSNNNQVDLSVENLSENNSIVEDDLNAYKQSLKEFNNLKEEKIMEHERSYNIAVNEVISKNLKVKWAIANNKYWFQLTENQDDSLNLLINIDHPFFKPYSRDTDFQIIIEKFVIAFIAAEEQARLLRDENGNVPISTIRNKMNEYLAKMAKNEDE